MWGVTWRSLLAALGVTHVRVLKIDCNGCSQSSPGTHAAYRRAQPEAGTDLKYPVPPFAVINHIRFSNLQPHFSVYSPQFSRYHVFAIFSFPSFELVAS